MMHRITAISLGMLLSSMSLLAQSPGTVPVPSQLVTARTAFLASGSAPGAGRYEPLIAQMVYTSFYKSLSSAGQYHVVGSPADAELSMVISTQSHVSSVTNGSSFDANFIRLEIYDTKSHALLWAIDEPLEGAYREKTFQKNVDKSIATLMIDLKILAGGANPGASDAPTPEPTKTRFSDEGKK